MPTRDLTADEVAEIERLEAEVDEIDRIADGRPLTRGQASSRSRHIQTMAAILDEAEFDGYAALARDRFKETGDPSAAMAAMRSARGAQLAREAAKFRGLPKVTDPRSTSDDGVEECTDLRDLWSEVQRHGSVTADFHPTDDPVKMRALSLSGNTVPTRFADWLSVYERTMTPLSTRTSSTSCRAPMAARWSSRDSPRT